MSLPPFETAVTEHGATVLRVLRGALGPHDADDCWQETFLAAMRAYPALRPDSDVRAWLVTIAHRKAIDWVRAAGRRAAPMADLPERGDARDADMDALEENLAAGRLWRQVAALPGKQRLAVAYRYAADLAYEDIARLLGCSEDAARRSAFEGIRKLRRDMGGLTSQTLTSPEGMRT